MENTDKKNWNIALNFVVEMKNEFINNFGSENLYDYKYKQDDYINDFNKEEYDYIYSSCVYYWASKIKKDLDNNKYYNVIRFLKVTEYNDLILLRYRSYAEISGILNEDKESEDEIVRLSLDELWGMYDGIYKECRSVVINFIKEELVLTPFRKFFNLNEVDEVKEDIIRKRIEKAESVEISDKMDGSMQSARYYDGKIVMSGSMALDRDFSWRLNDGYNFFNADKKYFTMCYENPDLTFIFEFISLDDAHVVDYNSIDEGLYLIGGRNVNTGDELSYKEVISFAEKYDIPVTKVLSTTFDDILNNLDEKKSNEAEGFVINIDGYKVKIKYNDYVSVHRILNDISSPNLIIESIADNKYEDLLSKVPSIHRYRIYNVSDIVFEYIEKMDSAVDDYLKKYYNNDVKTFMIAVDKNVPSYLKGFVKLKYKKIDCNYLKNERTKRYMKLNDIEERLDKLYNLSIF